MQNEDWVVVSKHDTLDDKAKKEFNRWVDIAEDLALLPENNVRIEQDEYGVRIMVSKHINNYYQGECAM